VPLDAQGRTVSGDGRWEAQLRLPDGQRKSIYAHSRRRVVAGLADVVWRVDHGLPLQAAKRRVGDYLDYWLEVTRRRVRLTTYEAYALNVGRLQPHGCVRAGVRREAERD
jgi:hypothetical protein